MEATIQPTTPSSLLSLWPPPLQSILHQATQGVKSFPCLTPGSGFLLWHARPRGLWPCLSPDLSSYCRPPGSLCGHSDLLLFVSQCMLLLGQGPLPPQLPLPGMLFSLSLLSLQRILLTTEAEANSCHVSLHPPPLISLSTYLTLYLLHFTHFFLPPPLECKASEVQGFGQPCSLPHHQCPEQSSACLRAQVLSAFLKSTRLFSCVHLMAPFSYHGWVN